MLVQKDDISRCIYLHQVLYISILDYIYQDLHTRKTRFHLFYVYGNLDMYNLDINKYILIYCPFWTVVSSILPNFRVLSFFFFLKLHQWSVLELFFIPCL